MLCFSEKSEHKVISDLIIVIKMQIIVISIFHGAHRLVSKLNFHFLMKKKMEREIKSFVQIINKDKITEKTVARIGKTEKMCKFANYIVYAPKCLSSSIP